MAARLARVHDQLVLTRRKPLDQQQPTPKVDPRIASGWIGPQGRVVRIAVVGHEKHIPNCTDTPRAGRDADDVELPTISAMAVLDPLHLPEYLGQYSAELNPRQTDHRPQGPALPDRAARWNILNAPAHRRFEIGWARSRRADPRWPGSGSPAPDTSAPGMGSPSLARRRWSIVSNARNRPPPIGRDGISHLPPYAGRARSPTAADSRAHRAGSTTGPRARKRRATRDQPEGS